MIYANSIKTNVFTRVWAAPTSKKVASGLAGSFLFYGSVYTLPMLVSLLNLAFYGALSATLLSILHNREDYTQKIFASVLLQKRKFKRDS